MENNNGNDLCTIIAQAISEMEVEQGKSLSVDEINLAELVSSHRNHKSPIASPYIAYHSTFPDDILSSFGGFNDCT